MIKPHLVIRHLLWDLSLLCNPIFIDTNQDGNKCPRLQTIWKVYGKFQGNFPKRFPFKLPDSSTLPTSKSNLSKKCIFFQIKKNQQISVKISIKYHDLIIEPKTWYLWDIQVSNNKWKSIARTVAKPSFWLLCHRSRSQ